MVVYGWNCPHCGGEMTRCRLCGMCEICDVDLHAEDCSYLALLLENGLQLAEMLEQETN